MIATRHAIYCDDSASDASRTPVLRPLFPSRPGLRIGPRSQSPTHEPAHAIGETAHVRRGSIVRDA